MRSGKQLANYYMKQKFNKNGFEYELLCHHGDVAAIYTQKKNGIIRYEVWRLRKYTSDYMDHIKAGDIRPPATTEWGMYGWTFMTEEASREKYNELIDNALS